MARLTIESGKSNGAEFPLAGDAVVGRAVSADISIDDASVSRRHAMLKWSDDAHYVVDLGSANGTLLNGRRLTRPTRLHPGDIVTFGAVRARYDSATQSKSPLPPSAPLPAAPDTSRIILSMPADLSSIAAAGIDVSVNQQIIAKRLAFLEKLGKLTGRSFDRDAIVTLVLDEVLELMPQAQRVAVMAAEEEGAAFTCLGARTRGGGSEPGRVSQTLLRQAIERREAFLVADTSLDARIANAESILMGQIRSALCAPMLFDGRLYGVLQVEGRVARTPLGAPELSLLAGIAAQIAIAFAFARLHAEMLEQRLQQHDQELAAKIQRRLLPSEIPRLASYEFALEYDPALFVGGDFFDFIEVQDGRWVMAIGDVAGKGVAAALYAAKVSSELRHHVAAGDAPAATLQRLNTTLCAGDAEGMFVTLALAALDPSQRTVTLANAGHTLPIVRRSNGAIRTLGEGGNLPLAIAQNAVFSESTFTLARGDVLLFYTDGVSEALNPASELFGVERLETTVRRSDGTAAGTVSAVISAVRSFMGAAPQSDDVTIVAVACT